jgi:hypothetical protein
MSQKTDTGSQRNICSKKYGFVRRRIQLFTSAYSAFCWIIREFGQNKTAVKSATRKKKNRFRAKIRFFRGNI